MPTDVSTWLREQREARGWTRSEMARQLIAAGRARGDRQLPGLDGMCHNIYRWERGGPMSERYRLHYCRAFGIQPAQFAPGPIPEPAAEPAVLAIPAVANRPGMPMAYRGQPVSAGVPVRPVPALPTSGFAVYREAEGPGLGEFSVEREVLMAAHEGSEHAERAERRDVGPVTMEQLRADVSTAVRRAGDRRAAGQLPGDAAGPGPDLPRAGPAVVAAGPGRPVLPARLPGRPHGGRRVRTSATRRPPRN